MLRCCSLAVRGTAGAPPPAADAAWAVELSALALRGPDGSVISTDVPPSISNAPAPPPGDYP